MNLIEAYEETNHFGRLLGMSLTVVKPGHIIYDMSVRQEHLAIPSVSHGGAVAALIDGALGVAGLSLAAEDAKVVSTVEYKVNYLKPALLGDQLKCEAKVLYSGKRLLHIEAKVTNQRGDMIATSAGTFNKYPAVKSGLIEGVSQTKTSKM